MPYNITLYGRNLLGQTNSARTGVVCCSPTKNTFRNKHHHHHLSSSWGCWIFSFSNWTTNICFSRDRIHILASNLYSMYCWRRITIFCDSLVESKHSSAQSGRYLFSKHRFALKKWLFVTSPNVLVWHMIVPQIWCLVRCKRHIRDLWLVVNRSECTDITNTRIKIECSKSFQTNDTLIHAETLDLPGQLKSVIGSVDIYPLTQSSLIWINRPAVL